MRSGQESFLAPRFRRPRKGARALGTLIWGGGVQGLLKEVALQSWGRGAPEQNKDRMSRNTENWL